MERDYVIETITQPNFYNPKPRTMEVYLSIPNEDEKYAGILILLAGFGGNAESNVFKKMRRLFAEEYHLATLQCNYFGYEFMQDELRIETIDSFCEMGPVQAMDNLVALKVVVDFLEEKQINYCTNNVIAYGFSHGGYLAHLMNAFMPSVLSCVIDNSSWLFPAYIDNCRVLAENGEETRFIYLIHEIIMDRQLYDMRYLYGKMENRAVLVLMHGLLDSLSPLKDKILFSSDVNNSSLEIIGGRRVDGERFHNMHHGLGADFIKVFHYVMKKYRTNVEQEVLDFSDRYFETDNATYHISNEDGIPILYFQLKNESEL